MSQSLSMYIDFMTNHKEFYISLANVEYYASDIIECGLALEELKDKLVGCIVSGNSKAVTTLQAQVDVIKKELTRYFEYIYNEIENTYYYMDEDVHSYIQDFIVELQELIEQYSKQHDKKNLSPDFHEIIADVADDYIEREGQRYA